ncbi:FUSC family protein [Clostridium sp. B9]|uniref:FUSC family protein n=1 Tax=Clostridium sp. B9 TaxID=3423224 RepID=UPI003D2F18A6
MINNLIKKFNLDVHAMKQEGTIAFLTFLISWFFFGIENAVLAYPIALTSSILWKENFKINPIEKITHLLMLDTTLVILSFLSTTNVVLGFFINFFSIFFIAYKFSIGYNPLLYKPFLMLYIFTNFYRINFNMLPQRLLSMFFGFSLIVIFQLFLNKFSYKTLIKESILKSITLLTNQVDNILDKNYNLDLQKTISKEINSICYNLYTTRRRKSLTNNIGSIQFKIYIVLDNFNISLNNLDKLYSQSEYESQIIKSFLKELRDSLIAIGSYLKNESSYQSLEKQLDRLVDFHNKLPDQFVFIHDISVSIKNLYLYLADINTLEEVIGYKPYKPWENTDKYQFKFRESLKLGTIKFNFSLRIALTLSIVLLISSLFDWTKMSWLGITIMSIMQPYYEDTKRKSKDRFKGNIFAVVIITVILNIFQSQFIYFITLTITLYLTYAFKSYYKLSLFTAISAICMASINYEVNSLALYRIFYLILGIIITYLANKILFPYSLDRGINELSFKLIKLINILSIELIKKKDRNEALIINLIIHINLLCNKLALRNIQKKYENINLLLFSTYHLTTSLSYYTILKSELGLICGVNKDKLICFQENLQKLIDEKASLDDLIVFITKTNDSLINCPSPIKHHTSAITSGYID